MKKVIFICLLGFISSCGFVENKNIFGKYHLIAVDAKNDLCMGYEDNNTGNYVCIVPSQILAYAKVGGYIFLTQKPYKQKLKTDTFYYIIPILNDEPIVYPEDSIIGPLKRQEFNALTSEMHLGNWTFKKLDE